MFKIIKKKNFICVFHNKELLFTQVILSTNILSLSNYNYTLFYIFKILIRFGLIKPLKK